MFLCLLESFIIHGQLWSFILDNFKVIEQNPCAKKLKRTANVSDIFGLFCYWCDVPDTVN